MSRLFMVFDVESVGLHGEAFAVAWVVIHGVATISKASFGCDPAKAQGSDESRLWVQKNVHAPTNCESPREVRDKFWAAWSVFKEDGALLAAECCWPVEARFLAQCIDDAPKEREWSGPYPLHDIATMLLVRGKSPLEKVPRLANELPEHDPLADATQSARLLMINLYDYK